MVVARRCLERAPVRSPAHSSASAFVERVGTRRASNGRVRGAQSRSSPRRARARRRLVSETRSARGERRFIVISGVRKRRARAIANEVRGVIEA
jgi:hypothetical protein